MLKHIVKNCEVKPDLAVVHNVPLAWRAARLTPPPHTHPLNGRGVAPASRQTAHKKLPRLFAEARQRECLTR